MQETELKMLKEKADQVKDPEEKRRIANTLNSLISKKRSEENKEKLQKLKRERRKAEQDLVASGKKPFYLKKGDTQLIVADERKMVLVEKYKEIKEKNPSANIDKILEKHRKKVSSQQMSSLPARRRHD